jgi:threonine dehydrogenase-like Zn-dependent dehydrogenase
MPRGLYIDEPQHVSLREYEEPRLEPAQVRVRSELASIKHGTLFHMFSGESPFKAARFDTDLRLFVPRDRSDKGGEWSGVYVGNMVVGVVTEVGSGVSSLKTGDRVFGYGPVRETLTMAAQHLRRLAPPMSATDAVCLDPAFFAFGVIRDGRVGVGDNVVAFGLGAIGQFVVQLLRRAGPLNLVAVDPIKKRRALAERFGADLALDPTACDVAMEVRERLGRGADVAVEASGHYAALKEALRTVGQCGRVSTCGYYKGADSHLELGADFFHNRIALIASLPDWNNPLRDELWPRERVYRTLIAMFQRGWLLSEGVVDPIVDFEDCAQAFMGLFRDPTNAVKLGVRF